MKIIYSILNIAKGIVPVAFLIIILSVNFIAVLYDYTKINFADAKIIVLWLPILSFIYTLSKQKVYLYIAAIPLIIINLLEVLHWLTIHGPITSASIYVIAETNYSEAQDFVTMYASWEKFVIPLVCLSGWLFFLKKERPVMLNGKEKIMVILCFMLCVSYLGYKIAIGKANRAFPSVISALIAYHDEIANYKKLAAKLGHRKKISASARNDAENQVFVLVIGESTNRNHLSLYGYRRNTSPQLIAMKNELLVFQNVISSYANTQPALKSALTNADTRLDDFYRAYSVIDLARSAGFYSYWLSNQAPLGTWDNEISVLAHTADKTVFVNLSGESNQAIRSISYDGLLFDALKKALQDQQHKKKLVILHLMGAHILYEKRYPPAFDVFNSHIDDKKNQTIDRYDNAILYNDFVVANFITLLKNYSAAQTVSALLYFSDHGEEVYDSKDYAGHDWNRLSRHHVEIPFLLWLSDSYQSQRPQAFATMQANINKPYMTQYLFHSFVDLMGISAPVLNLTHSIFSPHYQATPRIVYKTNYDRDLK